MIIYSWFVVRGSWFVVRGSWFVVRGSWFVVRRDYNLVPRATSHGPKDLTSINIIKTFNIILRQEFTGLHLDDLQDRLTGIAQPVHLADGDVKGLVRHKGLDDIFAGHIGYAAHHDPVFGTMFMSLK